MLKQYSFNHTSKHYKVTSSWSCFNDLREDSEPYMKLACFWWGMLTKREYFSSHQFAAMSSLIFYCQTYQ